MADSDKRFSRRRDFQVMVTLEHESKLQEFYSKNISGGGLFLETKEFLPVGELVKLNFTIPGRKDPLNITARVVRHHVIKTMGDDFNPSDVMGMGLAFEDMSKEEEQLIKQFIIGKNLTVQG